jgi:hypothetical protein
LKQIEVSWVLTASIISAMRKPDMKIRTGMSDKVGPWLGQRGSGENRASKERDREQDLHYISQASVYKGLMLSLNFTCNRVLYTTFDFLVILDDSFFKFV